MNSLVFNKKVFDVVDYGNNDATVTAVIEGRPLMQEYAENYDKFLEAVEAAKKRKAAIELKKTQDRNFELRSMVKYVHWSGNTCITYWNDGTITKAHWDCNEPFDPEKAILVCMARKLYKDTSLYNEVFHKYCDDGYNHFDNEVNNVLV